MNELESEIMNKMDHDGIVKIIESGFDGVIEKEG